MKSNNSVSTMEVETGGICREYGGKMTYVLHRTVEKLARVGSRDKFQVYVSERGCSHARVRNPEPVDTHEA
jgi:hypothetical protein